MDPFDLRQWPGFKEAGGCLTQSAYIDQVTIDSRRIDSHQALFVALKGSRRDGHQYLVDAARAGAKYALISSEWHSSEPLSPLILLKVPNPLKALQEIAKSYRMQLPVKIIGIAGSFGKTLVKDLLALLLNQHYRVIASPESFNSQIGVPLSVLMIRKDHDIAIIEAAMSQKNEMQTLANLIQPDYTILTPIGKKHLATLQDLTTVAQEAMQLILATHPQGWALLPRDPLIESDKLPFLAYFWNDIYHHLPHATPLSQERILPAPYQVYFPDQASCQGQMRIGYTYFLNLLNMAIKAAWLLRIPSQHIKDILSNYQIESTRTEIWKIPLGTTFINDPYCADLQSIHQALEHMNQISTHHSRKIFIFSGLRAHSTHLESDYRHIAKVLQKANLQRLMLVGQKPFTPLIEEMHRSSQGTVIQSYARHSEALHALRSELQPQDYVLIKGEKKIPLEELIEVFNESLNHNQCFINLAAIRANLLTLQKKLPLATRFMVMIKAFAYGTDAVHMAKFLITCGIDLLGVSYVDEAVALRRAGIQHSLFSIHAALYEVGKVINWDVEVGASDLSFLEKLAQEAEKQCKQAKVHLHIDTGMGRLGCRPEEALQLATFIKACPHLILEGIMTHFACAENPAEDAFTGLQIERFDQTIDQLKQAGIEPKWLHAANSSGAIRFHLPQYNMVRIGLAAYGLYASEAVRQAIDLRLALSLTSRIVGVNLCKRGESISYGRSYIVEREQQRIAVLPIGYFDGLHRQYSGRTHVMIRGQKAPMVGKICMDYMMVDVTEIPTVTIGDTALIFGEDEFGQYLSPEDLAECGNSIIHELMTCLGPRIQRIFIYEEGEQIR